MHTTNYTNTLILPAEDCKTTQALSQFKSGTIAALQFEALQDGYTLTSDDLLVAVTGIRRDVPRDEWTDLRAELFAKGQPCMRASPLVKTAGWAVHHDTDQKVALVDPAGTVFAGLMSDVTVTKLRGMRSKRA